MGLGFVFMYFAALESNIWEILDVLACFSLFISYFGRALCFTSNIILHNKTFTKKFVASVMGIYFATIGLGNKLAGTIGESSGSIGEQKYF